MPTVHYVKKAQKDYPQADIKKGESYYWWSFRFGGKVMSKVEPKPSQLTQSSFLQTLYGIQEQIDALEPQGLDDLKDEVDAIVADLQSLQDDTQSSLDNMPEGLQQGDVGQLLQERIDAIESAIGELEGIDYEPDLDVERESEDPDEVQHDLLATGLLDGLTAEAFKAAVDAEVKERKERNEEAEEEALTEAQTEVLDEVKAVTIDCG